MAQDEEPSGAQKAFGDFAPALVGFTDESRLLRRLAEGRCRR